MNMRVRNLECCAMLILCNNNDVQFEFISIVYNCCTFRFLNKYYFNEIHFEFYIHFEL